MIGPIWYCTRWNDLTRRPIAGYEWINERQARDRLERNEFIDVVESSTIGSDGLVNPRWVMGIAGLRGVAGGARLEFHDGQGSIRRAVDYQIIQGRLFRSNVVDFAYSTDQQRWEMGQAIAGVEVTVDPDGTGTVERWEASGDQELTEFTGLDVSGHWLEVPEFGDWDALTDPGRSATEIAAQGDDIVPIVGSRRPGQIESMIASTAVTLDHEDLARIDELIPKEAVKGARYPEQHMPDRGDRA